MKYSKEFSVNFNKKDRNDQNWFFQEDYTPACLLMRYEWGLPSKCPSCGVWSHHTGKSGRKNEIVKCQICGQLYDASQYHRDAIRKLSRCLRKRNL
ncbi:MAG: hypothetical protein C4519_13330 [Desulfobacteraceae bacterium]|nr:MAG: hypothetical protein C4519_13330 [Desulfobacteraceae bacterium]